VLAEKEVVVVVVVVYEKNRQINALNLSSRRCWQLAASGWVSGWLCRDDITKVEYTTLCSVRAMDDSVVLVERVL